MGAKFLFHPKGPWKFKLPSRHRAELFVRILSTEIAANSFPCIPVEYGQFIFPSCIPCFLPHREHKTTQKEMRKLFWYCLLDPYRTLFPSARCSCPEILPWIYVSPVSGSLGQHLLCLCCLLILVKLLILSVFILSLCWFLSC